MNPYANRETNWCGYIFVDIRAGIPPAIKPDDPAVNNDVLWNIIESCWSPNPQDRSSASQIHDFLRKVLWNDREPIPAIAVQAPQRVDTSNTSDCPTNPMERSDSGKIGPFPTPNLHDTQSPDVTTNSELPDVSLLPNGQTYGNVPCECILSTMDVSTDRRPILPILNPRRILSIDLRSRHSLASRR
jgi:hypothetical protein